MTFERLGTFWIFDLLAPGTYQLSANQSVTFDVEDLQEMATAYYGDKNEPLRPAPIVIGHPDNDSPAYGTVAAVSVRDRRLYGFARDLDASFVRSLKKGVYQRHGAQFWAPDEPGNPRPGKWLLKHLGFAGTAPTLLRGYFNTDAEFSEFLGGKARVVPYLYRSGKHPYFVEFATIAIDAYHRRARACAVADFFQTELGQGIAFSDAEAIAGVIDRAGQWQPLPLRPGKMTDSRGVEHTFSDADIRELVAGYQPELHEAPIIIGEPAADAPAWGWVKSLRMNGSGTVEYLPHQVAPEFQGWLNSGRGQKKSVVLYAPDAPGNPFPGRWYLRDIRHKGENPPVIEGLRKVSFAAAGAAAVVEFVVAALPTNTGRQDSAEVLAGEDIARRALDFQEAERGRGRRIGIDMAVQHVTRAGARTVEYEGGDIARRAADFQEDERRRGRFVDIVAAVQHVTSEPSGSARRQGEDLARRAADFQLEEARRGRYVTIDMATKHIMSAGPKSVALQADDVARRALDFQQEEAGRGRSIDIVAAVQHVTSEPSGSARRQGEDLARRAADFQLEEARRGQNVSFIEALEHVSRKGKNA